jgi:hypothetical protein
MSKMRLQVDELLVESFDTAATSPGRGTVHGYASLYWEDCYESETCAGAGWPCDPTDQSCGGTCYEFTCHPGCGGTGGGGGDSHGNPGSPCTSTCNDEDPG